MNTEPLIGGEDREGASGGIDAAMDVRRGSSNLSTVSGSGIIRYREGRHVAFLIGKTEYGSQQRTRFLDHDMEHARYRVRLQYPVYWEAYAQHERDSFRRLSVRTLAGTGPRLQFDVRSDLQLVVAASYMLEYERLRDGPEPDAREATFAHRLSNHVQARAKVTERLRISLSLFVQPKIDDWGDARVLQELELLSKVSDHLAMKLTFTEGYDSRPPVGVNSLNAAYKGSLQWTF